MRLLRTTGLILSDTLLTLALLWVLGLLCYRPESLPFLLAVAAALCYLKRFVGKSLRLWLWLLFAGAVLLYQLLPSPMYANWQTPWAAAPNFTLKGDLLTIENLRDFRYRSEDDYDVRYRTETYNLAELTGVDLGECHWDGMEAICHTMLSFSFADGRHLVVSAETRLPEGVEQDTIGGIYKLYGLLYVFGTEEDIFALRTNYRHEDLTLYPLNTTPEQARKLLLAYVHIAQETEREQRPYNTVTDNCSSGLVRIFRHFAPNMPKRYDLLPLHNSSISRLIHAHGGMKTRAGESYEALSRRCYLGYDLAADAPGAYADAIRRKREEAH